jgi:hypothetical protein
MHTRCVLWHAASNSVPDELLRSLRKRDIEIVEVTDQYAAVARACLNERAARNGTAGWPPSAIALVLLLVEPSSLDGAAGAADEVHRFSPRTAVWWYDARATPRLRPATDADIESWRAPSDSSRRAPHVPPLRLTGVAPEASHTSPVARGASR